MLRRFLLMFGFMLVGNTCLAAEPAPDAESDTAEASSAAATASADSDTESVEADDDEPAAGSLDGEGFVPSVQISEDLSVSFPTDI